MPQTAHINPPFEPPPKALGTVAKPLCKTQDAVASFMLLYAGVHSWRQKSAKMKIVPPPEM